MHNISMRLIIRVSPHLSPYRDIVFAKGGKGHGYKKPSIMSLGFTPPFSANCDMVFARWGEYMGKVTRPYKACRNFTFLSILWI